MYRSPYDATIEALYDGDHTGKELFEGTPDTVDALLTDRGRALLANPAGAFADALAEADAVCAGWAPDAPVRLYVTPTDVEAAPGSTEVCRGDFADSGTDAQVVNVGDTDHLGSAKLGTGDAVRWFLNLAGK